MLNAECRLSADCYSQYMSVRVLRDESTSGNIGLFSRQGPQRAPTLRSLGCSPRPPRKHKRALMIASSIRRICLIVLLVNLFIAFGPAAPSHAQTKANASAAAEANTAAAATAWTVKLSGGIRWQQITPA